MAWPGNNYNSFWESMYGSNSHQPTHGAGVDHAPPPPPPPAGLPPFMNPDFWNRWSQRRGWEDFAGPNEGEPRGPGGPHGPHGPHGRHAHAHAHGRRRGGRGGRHGRGGENENAERGGPDLTDNENGAFPPEYITDDEVAEATAAEKKAGEKDGSPDTMMGDVNNTEDPPEELPNLDDSPRQRHHGGRHGRRGGRGAFAHEGFGHGPHHGRHGGARGPPPFGPFGFGGMFGGGPRRHRSRGHGHHGGPPPPGFEAFFGPPRGGPPHHGPGARHHHHHHDRSGSEGPGPFDLRGMMGALANHPYAQQMREYLERAGGPGNTRDAGNTSSDSSDDELEGGGNSITPPLDLFEQADRWVLHLAVPGAKKEDVGVQWDADRSVLSVSGVVHRPGDEEFLKGLVGAGERSVGLFSREVRLPPLTSAGEPAGAKEEVDSDGISARMEDGVLIVTVPKVERDWTEVKRVEIE